MINVKRMTRFELAAGLAEARDVIKKLKLDAAAREDVIDSLRKDIDSYKKRLASSRQGLEAERKISDDQAAQRARDAEQARAFLVKIYEAWREYEGAMLVAMSGEQTLAIKQSLSARSSMRDALDGLAKLSIVRFTPMSLSPLTGWAAAMGMGGILYAMLYGGLASAAKTPGTDPVPYAPPAETPSTMVSKLSPETR